MAKDIRFNRRYLCGTMLPFLLWALVALAITGCAAPLLQPDDASRAAAPQATVPEPASLPSPTFASPLPTPVSTPPLDPLWHNTWRITEVVHWGDEVSLDDPGAITVTFDENGTLAIRNETCGVAAFAFSPRSSARRPVTFTLDSFTMTRHADGCSRFQEVVMVVGGTGEFEIQDEHVVLAVDERRNPLKTQPNAALVEPLWRNRWQMQEIVRDGQEVAFDALGAVWVTFNVDGILLVKAEHGNATGWHMVPVDNQRYLLVGAGGTAMGYDPQEPQMTDAVEATRAYEFQDDQLVLFGEDVRIVLAVGEVYPPFPTAHPVLLLNRFQWVEGTHRGQALVADRLQPLIVSFTFSEVGLVYLQSRRSGCGVEASYRTVEGNGQSYQLIQEEPLRLNCGEDVNAQFRAAADALAATTNFEVQDDQLILTGNDVRIVLAPWSLPQY
jgi:hypothetical protein